MYFGLIVPAYSYAYFAPQIIEGYGYSGMYRLIFNMITRANLPSLSSGQDPALLHSTLGGGLRLFADDRICL